MRIPFRIFLYLFACVSLTVGCRKFVEVDPPNYQIIGSEVFKTNETAIAAQTVIYSQMASGSTYNFSVFPSLYADEFGNYSTDEQWIEIYKNDTHPTNLKISGLWNDAYKYIYEVNAVIERLSNTSGVDEKVKNQIVGEAHFIRAFWYFYLVNLFGDVPLVLSSDYHVNAVLARTSIDSIYKSIVSDLTIAKTKLKEYYVSGDCITQTAERLRPNKWVAASLLARVYLYQRDWNNALNESNEVLEQTNLYQLSTDLNAVFLKNSQDAIFQL